jgi:hypothetical protein
MRIGPGEDVGKCIISPSLLYQLTRISGSDVQSRGYAHDMIQMLILRNRFESRRVQTIFLLFIYFPFVGAFVPADLCRYSFRLGCWQTLEKTT